MKNYLYHPKEAFKAKYAAMLEVLKPQQKVVMRYVLDNQFWVKAVEQQEDLENE